MKNVILSVCAVLGATAMAMGGTSVEGDEAREVYNTFIEAGATRVDIPEGPTIIIDDVRCAARHNGGALTAANCTFVGDPKLSRLNGDLALRLFKGLVAMGVHQKPVGNDEIHLAVLGLNCGILHNVNNGARISETEGTASCFFMDQN